MKRQNCSNLMCKFPKSNILKKCKECKQQYCSNECQMKHTCKNDKDESLSSLKLIRKTSVNSRLIKSGAMLKETNNNDPLFVFSNFEIVKIGKNPQILGNGIYGDIFLAKNKKNNKLYAIKQMNKIKIQEKKVNEDIIMNEIYIHSKLIHDNIVRLYSYNISSDAYNLIMDYSPKGTLFDLLKKIKCLDEKLAFKYFIQIASAVNFLHEYNLVHRDIKPQNILLDENNVVKLCDFGLCSEISVGNRITICGTYEYMAPEIMNQLPYNTSVDLWSLGVILYEMLHGVSPFKSRDCENNKDGIDEILKNITKGLITFNNNISYQCQDLISNLLSIDNTKRIKLKEIFKHPWIKANENELCDEQKNNRNTDNISTKHNSIVSATSIKENNKKLVGVNHFPVKRYTKDKVSDEKELNEFCLLEDNDSIIDRVLDKVNEKGKYKSCQKIEFINENDKIYEEESLKNFSQNNNNNFNDEEGHLYNIKNDFINDTNREFDLLNEIKYDIQKFNEIVNPKTIKKPININNHHITNKCSSTKMIASIEDIKKNDINKNNYYSHQIVDLNLTPNTKATENTKSKSHSSIPTPNNEETSKVKNNIEDKKSFITSIEILNNSQKNKNIIENNIDNDEGFWSFLNPFKCGKNNH